MLLWASIYLKCMLIDISNLFTKAEKGNRNFLNIESYFAVIYNTNLCNCKGFLRTAAENSVVFKCWTVVVKITDRCHWNKILYFTIIFCELHLKLIVILVFYVTNYAISVRGRFCLPLCLHANTHDNIYIRKHLIN